MKSKQDFLKEFFQQTEVSHLVHADSIPDIQLYMDQVTTFMEEHLSTYKRFPEDKVLTKTMINNYAKNKLLPAPDKKKYSKDHMILLLFIYYFKSFLSIADIKSILNPITDEFFEANDELDLAALYEIITSAEKDCYEEMTHSLEHTLELSSKLFLDAEDPEQLQRFAFICLVSYDIFMRKMLLERMIDEMNHEVK